jgi:hypothetical protein
MKTKMSNLEGTTRFWNNLHLNIKRQESQIIQKSLVPRIMKEGMFDNKLWQPTQVDLWFLLLVIYI